MNLFYQLRGDGVLGGDPNVERENQLIEATKAFASILKLYNLSVCIQDQRIIICMPDIGGGVAFYSNPVEINSFSWQWVINQIAYLGAARAEVQVLEFDLQQYANSHPRVISNLDKDFAREIIKRCNAKVQLYKPDSERGWLWYQRSIGREISISGGKIQFRNMFEPTFAAQALELDSRWDPEFTLKNLATLLREQTADYKLDCPDSFYQRVIETGKRPMLNKGDRAKLWAKSKKATSTNPRHKKGVEELRALREAQLAAQALKQQEEAKKAEQAAALAKERKIVRRKHPESGSDENAKPERMDKARKAIIEWMKENKVIIMLLNDRTVAFTMIGTYPNHDTFENDFLFPEIGPTSGDFTLKLRELGDNLHLNWEDIKEVIRVITQRVAILSPKSQDEEAVFQYMRGISKIGVLDKSKLKTFVNDWKVEFTKRGEDMSYSFAHAPKELGYPLEDSFWLTRDYESPSYIGGQRREIAIGLVLTNLESTFAIYNPTNPEFTANRELILDSNFPRFLYTHGVSVYYKQEGPKLNLVVRNIKRNIVASFTAGELSGISLDRLFQLLRQIGVSQEDLISISQFIYSTPDLPKHSYDQNLMWLFGHNRQSIVESQPLVPPIIITTADQLIGFYSGHGYSLESIKKITDFHRNPAYTFLRFVAAIEGYGISIPARYRATIEIGIPESINRIYRVAKSSHEAPTDLETLAVDRMAQILHNAGIGIVKGIFPRASGVGINADIDGFYVCKSSDFFPMKDDVHWLVGSFGSKMSDPPIELLGLKGIDHKIRDKIFSNKTLFAKLIARLEDLARFKLAEIVGRINARTPIQSNEYRLALYEDFFQMLRLLGIFFRVNSTREVIYKLDLSNYDYSSKDILLKIAKFGILSDVIDKDDKRGIFDEIKKSLPIQY